MARGKRHSIHCCLSNPCLVCQPGSTRPDQPQTAWQPIETAPRDGTKIDLLYPYPRGRTIDCYWRQDEFTGPAGGWFWKTPIWGNGELLPEDQWSNNCYPNMQPTHWMPAPSLAIPRQREGDK